MIEVQLSKSDILELYLNRIYLSAGVYGVEAMSQHLYRKPAKSLTLAEAALIAGLLRAPSTLSPWTNYDGALERSHLVLRRMREQGYITPAQEAAAATVRPRIQPYRSPVDTARGLGEGLSAPAVPQRIRRRPPARLAGAHDLPSEPAGRGRAGGRGRHPPVEPPQPRGGARRDRSAHRRRRRAGRRRRLPRQHVQPRDAFAPPAGIGLQAVRVRGRARPRLLAGVGPDRISTASARPNDPEWHPSSVSHDGDAIRTAITLRAALAESNNAAAALLQQHLGSRAVLSLASDVGLRDLPDVPSLALGSGIVSPLDLAAAYTMFPGGGEVVRPRGIVTVLDADGVGGAAPAGPARARRQRPPSAFQMVTMLQEVVESGTAAGVAHARRSRDRSAARPARPTAITMPGSSASRRRSSPPSGSASISRRRSAPTPTPRASRCRSGPTS